MAAVPAAFAARFARSRVFLDRNGIGVLCAILLLVLCWQLAERTWRHLDWLAPQPLAHGRGGLPASDPAASGQIAAAQLFGVATAPAVAAATVAPPPEAPPLNLQLKGVYAPIGPFPGVAILNLNGRDQPVKAGTEIVPGAVLALVGPRYIEVRRNGAIERVELDDHAGGGAPAAQPGAAGMPPPAAAPRGRRGNDGRANAPDQAAFRLNVTTMGENAASFSRSELNTALQDPRQLKNIGNAVNAPNGGVVLETVPPGSLIDKLGLKQGDVLKQINDKTVTTQSDLMKLYQDFGQVSQVHIQGERAGKPLAMNFTITP